jgi:DNA-binding SARP family transcriptional activator
MGVHAGGKVVVTGLDEPEVSYSIQTESVSRATVQLDIRLLGRFHLWRNQELISAKEWKTNKEKALLKILLTQPGHVFLQDQLLALLWSHLTPKAAIKNLWVCVNHLRHILEPSLDKPANSRFIVSHLNGYQFNRSQHCAIDTDAFGELIKQGDAQLRRQEFEAATKSYEVAAALYQGDFLEEDLYEDWSIESRHQLKSRYLDLLNNLGELYQQANQNEEALHCYQKFLQKEPCRESVWRKAMLCYWRMGERDQALLAFKRCAEILRRELEVEPMTETIELRNNIARGT